MACALASLLVTLAFLAWAWFLTVLAPAIWVACALARHIITLAVRVTSALAFAVGTPELSRTLYRGREMVLFNNDLYFELLKTHAKLKTNIV